MVTRLQSDIPGIRVAIFSHGDYAESYVTKHVDFTTDISRLKVSETHFISSNLLEKQYCLLAAAEASQRTTDSQCKHRGCVGRLMLN